MVKRSAGMGWNLLIGIGGLIAGSVILANCTSSDTSSAARAPYSVTISSGIGASMVKAGKAPLGPNAISTASNQLFNIILPKLYAIRCGVSSACDTATTIFDQ